MLKGVVFNLCASLVSSDLTQSRRDAKLRKIRPRFSQIREGATVSDDRIHQNQAYSISPHSDSSRNLTLGHKQDRATGICGKDHAPRLNTE